MRESKCKKRPDLREYKPRRIPTEERLHIAASHLAVEVIALLKLSGEVKILMDGCVQLSKTYIQRAGTAT